MERMRRVFLVLLLGALFCKEVSAAQHVVGGSQGWVESADLNSWASGETFKVGDQVVFKYSSGLHSVVELASESAYKNCDLGTSVNSMNTGNDVVKLVKPGTRYFACGTLGHCGQGMKVKITTVSSSAPPSPSPSSSSSTPSTSPKPASTSGASSSITPFAYIVALLGTSLAYVFRVC
ncbi:mavicyanin-like [Mangifera indica]|uniref:mavicyanin-like n=1 Tax=Mangifera indica TaxID=29780 RepID=UPI001CFA9FFB|nr:mavicyanin-like [Mangifera indica]